LKPREVRTLTKVHLEEREADRKPLSLALIRRLFTFTRPHARTRNTLLVMVFLRAIQLPVTAWVIGTIMGGPISHLDTRGLWLGVLGYAAMAAFTQFTMYYRIKFALQLGEQVVHDLRNLLFHHLQKMPMSFFHKTKVGRIISRFTSDSDAMRAGIQDVLFITLVQGGQMLIAGGFMLYYNWLLFLVIIGMAPVIHALNRYFSTRLSAAYRSSQESFSRITATLAESVQGIRVTQGFSREKLNADMFAELLNDHARYNLRAGRTAGMYFPLLELNSQIFVGLVLLIGGWQVFTGRSDVASLYQFLMMTALFFGPIQGIANQYNQALTAMAGAERVFQLLDTPPEWTDPVDARELPSVNGRVEFRNVTFGYDPATPVLHDITFAAEPGRTIALVGHTGSGKTSIINLIAKFYLPTRGEVLIDGHDIRTLSTEGLHRHMGIVLQQNFLFTGTVMENIRIGRLGATDAEVFAAADALDCRDLVEALPEGFQTKVGERGAGISLGQRQLICFTRAMLADPAILILDEATSAVDTLTEARIQKALARLLRNRTSFVVAHRLSTIRNADHVLVLDQGRIVERGNHRQLLVMRGVYARLYRQFIRATQK